MILVLRLLVGVLLRLLRLKLQLRCVDDIIRTAAGLVTVLVVMVLRLLVGVLVLVLVLALVLLL